MSKKIVLALGGNALGDDLAGQMKAVKITSQAIVCNQVNHLIPTRVLVKGGEITCKILK